MIITPNIIAPVTDQASSFLNIKQSHSLLLLPNLSQCIWFILFLFLDFMQIVCLRLMAIAANLCMQIDSPLCWVRLLWSAAICIWKWSGLEWAWGEVQLGMMGKRELATISWKLCLPKCLQQHTSPTLCNFPFLFLCLSFLCAWFNSNAVNRVAV